LCVRFVPGRGSCASGLYRGGGATCESCEWRSTTRRSGALLGNGCVCVRACACGAKPRDIAPAARAARDGARRSAAGGAGRGGALRCVGGGGAGRRAGDAAGGGGGAAPVRGSRREGGRECVCVRERETGREREREREGEREKGKRKRVGEDRDRRTVDSQDSRGGLGERGSASRMRGQRGIHVLMTLGGLHQRGIHV
jgi:hypothetical protein